MSVGIGVRYPEGFVVCADTKIVRGDYSTTFGRKITSSESNINVVIANAETNDGNAGQTLAGEITADLESLQGGGSQLCEEAIKNRMRSWYAGYGSPGAQPPEMKLIIAIHGIGFKGLYFCEPPQTLIKYPVAPIVIGAGAVAVEPLLPIIFHDMFPLKSTILRLSYLMYRAKKEQAALVGGETDLVVMSFGTPVIPKGITWAERDEIATAEVLAEFVDDVMRECAFGLLGSRLQPDVKAFLAEFNSLFSEKADMFGKVQFPSLKEVGPDVLAGQLFKGKCWGCDHMPQCIEEKRVTLGGWLTFF